MDDKKMFSKIILEMFDNEKKNIFNYSELKEVKNFSFEALTLQKQNKFHFIQDSILNKHYTEIFYRLNLQNHELKQIGQGEFINRVDSDSWLNKYFVIIESLIKKAGYEEKATSLSNWSGTSRIEDFNDNEMIEALIFLTFRSRQFTPDQDLFGEFLKKGDGIFKENSLAASADMQIEYILRALKWFGRDEDLKKFIEELSEKISELEKKEDIDADDGIFTFVMAQSMPGENWKKHYNYFYDMLEKLKNSRLLICFSNTSSIGITFPMLQEPIGIWTKTVSQGPPHNSIDFDILYLQISPSFCFYIVSPETYHFYSNIIYKKIEMESGLPTLKTNISKFTSSVRKELYFDDKSLKAVYGEEKILTYFKNNTTVRTFEGFMLMKDENRVNFNEESQISDILEKMKMVK